MVHYPLLDAEIFGTVMCMAASLCVLFARGFENNCGQGTRDANLHGALGTILEWAVVRLDRSLPEAFMIGVVQAP